MFLFNVLQSQQDGELKFAHEVENLPVTNLSMLEVNFETARHVYGAFVLQLLRISRIRVATKKLMVVLPWWYKVILRQPYGSYIETYYMSNTIYIYAVFIYEKQVHINNTLSCSSFGLGETSLPTKLSLR
jgi:hypothetical protein